MKICPWCESGYPDELMQCPLHGGILSEIRDLKPGMLVRGTYRIQRKLSQGGMGHVYLAKQILLGELQVLKFLPRELSGDQNWTNRFLPARSADAAADSAQERGTGRQPGAGRRRHAFLLNGIYRRAGLMEVRIAARPSRSR